MHRILPPWPWRSTGGLAGLLAVSLGTHAAGLLALWHGGQGPGAPRTESAPVHVVLSSRWVSGAAAVLAQPLPSSATDRSEVAVAVTQASRAPVAVPRRAAPPRTSTSPSSVSAAQGAPTPPTSSTTQPPPLFPPLPEAPEYLRTASLDTRPAPLGDIEPVYPEAADRQQGRVVLRLLINEHGAVDNAGVVEAFPPGLFEQEALAAFSRAAFSPGTRAGAPVKSQIVIGVDFIPFNRGAVSGQGY